MLYTADFETTTDPNDCRVWAWGVCEIGKPDNFVYGNTIEGFMEYAENSENSTFYFHNEKFDGEFLFSYLFKQGFKHTTEKKDRKSKTFNTLISDKGLFYSIEIIFKKSGGNIKKVTIYDSIKIIPFSVDQVAKAFGLPINKLKLDYKEYREVGHELTSHEVEYLKHDVKIMAMALDTLFSQGLKKMTQGGNALEDYKQIFGDKQFDRHFPSPDLFMDGNLRQAYKGGFTYVQPEYKEKDIGEGLVIDVNSLYPWAMYYCPLPFGTPQHYYGKYEFDNVYPLYIQVISCTFELKPNKIPTIQIKHGDYAFVRNEYLTDSGDEDEVVMVMTNVDLELFLEQYETYNLRYIEGWKFQASTELFKPYIDKWMKVKIESTLNGNKGMRTLSKLMLNSLYGKFAVNPVVGSKYPYDKDGVVGYKMGVTEFRKPLYVPLASFVTAWARHKTITSAQKMYKYFVYADTDSLHLHIKLPEEIKKMSNKELEHLTTKDLIKFGMDIPEDFEIDPVNLGAWKVESKFNRARFLRQKSYIEDSNPVELWNEKKFNPKLVKEFCEETGLDPDTEIAKFKGWYNVADFKITCAGMPDRCYPHVTWDNFRILSSYAGKLTPKHVEGGIVLEETIFTIRPT